MKCLSAQRDEKGNFRHFVTTVLFSKQVFEQYDMFK